MHLQRLYPNHKITLVSKLNQYKKKTFLLLYKLLNKMWLHHYKMTWCHIYNFKWPSFTKSSKRTSTPPILQKDMVPHSQKEMTSRLQKVVREHQLHHCKKTWQWYYKKIRAIVCCSVTNFPQVDCGTFFSCTLVFLQTYHVTCLLC